MMACETKYIKYRDSFLGDIFRWLQFLASPIYWIIISTISELIYDITIAPVYFWKLCWHLDGRYIWKILSNSDRGAVQHKTLINSDGMESKRTRNMARP